MSTEQAPDPPATAEQVAAARHDHKLANVLYHDWEAASYDEKWSISYDERCITYAADRFRLVAGDAGWPYGQALELGCGTGFFLLNLMQAGVAKRGSVTDLSPGMVAVALRNAEHLALDVDGRVADAERIPYDDDTFDLVVGHAVLHHIPDVDAAFREVLRVLSPGGRFVFAGEPTRIGDRYARRLGALTWKVATTVTRLPPLRGWRRPQSELDESSRAAALEGVVDVHVFDPDELERIVCHAGACDVRVVTEELTAAMFGWPVRTFEAAVAPGRLGMGWAMFAYRSWQRLSWLDRCVLARVLPRAWFYNALVTGTKAGHPTGPPGDFSGPAHGRMRPQYDRLVSNDDLETRVGRLERDMVRFREEAAATRALAALADRDVSEIRSELHGHHRVLNALRETQIEQGRILDEHSRILDEHGRILDEHGRILAEHSRILAEHGRKIDEYHREMREGFAMLATGMAQITALLTNIAGPEHGGR